MNKEIIEKFDIKTEEVLGKWNVSYINPSRIDYSGIVNTKDRIYIREDFATEEEALISAIKNLSKDYSLKK